MDFKKIAKRLTGISTPVFGVSWNPPESDCEIARKLITFFEDRRALYNPYDIETPSWVVKSVLKIREKLTDTLETLNEESEISPHLRAMRAACRKFMDETEGHGARLFRFHHEGLFAALGELRAVFGIHVAQLSVKYGIDIEGDLATILPVEDREEDKGSIEDCRK
jgi:hypothetical protein